MCLLSTCYVASSGQDPGGAACTETQRKEGTYHNQGAGRKPLRPALLSEEESGLRLCALVAQSRMALCDPVDCSPPGSSAHGLLQARILEWVAIPFSRVNWKEGPGPDHFGHFREFRLYSLCNKSFHSGSKNLSPHIAPVVHLTYFTQIFPRLVS